jgi:protein-S-isoprenylcysteine O-methyltransferase Ste14
MKTKRDVILAVIFTLAVVGQIALTFIFYNENANTIIINLGWVILWISALFGWLPIFTFKKYGGVPKGKSYIETSILVERGVYAIVRHPQYLAGILIGVSLPLISQHWLVAVLGLIVIVVTYFNTFDEEALNLAKFGEEYRQYMQRVPRLNFLLGIYRLLVKKR